MALFIKLMGIDILFVTMLIGLIGTLSPKFPGTLLIFAGAVFYGYLTDFISFEIWMMATLGLLVFIAEVGSRLLRIYLTRHYSSLPQFSANATVGNIAGIVAADALLGPVFGVLLWELIAGKTLLPRLDTIGKILSRLVAVAALRLLSALIMIFIIYVYIVI